ncbi:hypothetical protein BJ508DRAFT_154096 [Ascobolus immersus RN42]|uniref:Uncharacterized protein n=1 Tax=Ascobolus immersus RN42 TaxID=1160509 RepID=A0A3N4HZV7_ASCIM|nr:hypothetical protein BJ508DRAFT_154096 [Ascobolus immersus RN42]
MARGRNNSSRSPSSNLYSSKRPALIKDFQLRPTIRKHLHVRKGRTPPPITLNEAFSEFEDALEAIVQLDEEPHSDGHDSEGSEVAIIMLLGWAEQLRLEWAFMKGARSAAPPLPTESGRPIMEYATPEGSPPASGLVTRGLGRLTAESILRPPQTQRKPDHTVKQFQRGGANRRQTSEGEDERASVNGAHVDTHTDEAMDEDADEDGDEMEERDTIPPDDYDYEWEIEAQRARKRRRSGKVSDVATEKNQTESGFVDLGVSRQTSSTNYQGIGRGIFEAVGTRSQPCHDPIPICVSVRRLLSKDREGIPCRAFHCANDRRRSLTPKGC